MKPNSISPLPPAFKPKIPIKHESPRKKSAPAILSPSQQSEIMSATTNSSRHQRSTYAGGELQDFGVNYDSSDNVIPNKYYSTDVDDLNKGISGQRPRITKRNSLSSLVEAGLVAPPTPLQMKFHNVIPSRATLYFRQRSRHHSREDINTTPSSPDKLDHLQMLNRKSIRTPRTSRRKTGYRDLYSIKSSDPFQSSDPSDQSDININNNRNVENPQQTMIQLVQDIDGLMSQLTTIKRRLSLTDQSNNESKFQSNNTPSGPQIERQFSPLIEEKGLFLIKAYVFFLLIFL